MLVNLPITAITAAMIVLAGRVVSLLLPSSLYFTFESLILEHAGRLRYYAIGLKLTSPVVIGFLVTTMIILTAKSATPAQRKAFRAIHPSLFAAGSLASFVMVWPFILYWDLFASPSVQDKLPIFLVAYLFYFAAFGYFCLLGGNIALVTFKTRVPMSVLRFAQRNVTWADGVRFAALGSFATIVGTAIADLFGAQQ